MFKRVNQDFCLNQAKYLGCNNCWWQDSLADQHRIGVDQVALLFSLPHNHILCIEKKECILKKHIYWIANGIICFEIT